MAGAQIEAETPLDWLIIVGKVRCLWIQRMDYRIKENKLLLSHHFCHFSRLFSQCRH